MANPWAGEVALTLDGERHVLKLTLGALAELESGLDSGTLVDLVERFESGAFSTRDVLALIVAGLRGGRLAGHRKGPAGGRDRRRPAGRSPRRRAALGRRVHGAGRGMSGGTPIDWPALMRAGIRGLGLRPSEFWALTPAELELMLGNPSGVAPLKRNRLDDLMSAYPDKTGDDHDG